METLTLASTSPQRREIIQRLGVPFRVLTAHVEEDLARGDTPEDLVRLLAREKVEAVRKAYRLSGNWIVGADTLVLLGDERIGKPKDRDQARQFLTAFSGRNHRVMTGVALSVASTGDIQTFCETTTVSVSELTEADIEWYLNTEEWQGAAGGYRIQGRGACLVDRIEGSYTNVVGLPIHRLYGMLRQYQYQLPA
jgi:septum formation protein